MIVASFREDGIKLSVRSEDPEVHAGNLLHKALLGIGNGGGHATMGGGFISKEGTIKQQGLGIGSLLKPMAPDPLCRCAEGLLEGYIVTVCPSEDAGIVCKKI